MWEWACTRIPGNSRAEASGADSATMLRAGHAVAVCALALLVLGVLMVSSAAMSLQRHDAVTIETILLSRSSLYMGLAMFAMLMTSMIPIRRLVPGVLRTQDAPTDERWDAGVPAFLGRGWVTTWIREMLRSWPLWVGAGVTVAFLATAYVPGISSPRKGAHRWVNLHIPGFDSVQPSELAKWSVVLLIAWFAARYVRRLPSFWFGLVPGLAAAGMIAAFIVIEDLGTGVLIGLVACVMLVGAGAKLWHLLIMAPVPLAGAVVAVMTSPYRMARIEAFLNPYVDPKGKGYHAIQSLTAVSNGDVSGRGLGFGLQKFGYLPEDTTDFLFAVICEELGVAGAAVVLALFAGLMWALWTILKRESWPVLKLVVLGVMATIGIQALINLAVVTGLGPTKGIALPLLSSGGTGWLLTAAALGLVISIDRSQPKDSSVSELPQAAAIDLDVSGSEIEMKEMPVARARGAASATPTLFDQHLDASPA